MAKYWENKIIVSNLIVEIEDGGFLSNEKSNESFISDQISEQREFLIKGIDDCLFVIAPNDPKIEKVNLQNNESTVIATELKRNANRNKAYFGFTEWTDQEFCITANTDGLKLFASTLLEATEIEQEGNTHGLSTDEMEWLHDEVEIDFIKWTNKVREDIIKSETKEESNKWWNYLLWIVLLLVGYLIIAGMIFTFKWITGT